MDNQTIVHKIEGARANDSFGLVTQDALHAQLKTFTSDDWKQASTIYSKTNAGPEGFYITDDNGHVEVHNDMRAAHQAANTSALDATLNDAKFIAGGMLGLDGVWGLSAGLVEWSHATAWGTGVGLLSQEGLGIGAAAAGSAALWGALGLGAVGAAVTAGDFVHNYYRKSRAQDEINTSSEISFDKR